MTVTGAVSRRAAKNNWLKSSAMSFIYFTCGLLVSRGTVLGTLAPFGASFAAAAPRERLLPSLLGAAAGYIILVPTDSFRYLAVLAAIGAARWLLGDIKKISKSRLFAPLTAFVPVLATGIALLFGSGSTLSRFSSCVIEALLASAAAYFMATAVRLTADRRSLSTLTGQETACVVMTGCVLILALGSLAIENVSLGRILAIVAVLMCARYGGVAGGAVSGAAAGAVFGLSSAEYGFLSGAYAFGGLMAGLFSGLKKIGSALAFFVSCAIISLAFGGGAVVSAALIESSIGAVLFMLIPRGFGDYVAPLFSRGSASAAGDAVRNNLVMRLDFAARAIRNVRSDVEQVSKSLTELYAPSFESVCDSVAAEVCSGCGLRMYCYEHESGVTRDDFFRLEEILARTGRLSEKNVEAAFVKSCCKKGEIACSMTKNYRILQAAREAQRRVGEIRGAVAGQFAGIGDILGDLSRDLGGGLRCDSDSEQRITEALSALGAVPEGVTCMLGENGRMRVELRLDPKGEPLKKGQLAREVSRCCGRRFDLPLVTDDGGELRAALCELPRFDLEIGTDQHIADGGKLCGDCIDYFNDGAGRTYALICDGMGTGGRAAVDGSMAVSSMGRLLRAGLSADSALQIVNAALMVKSEDESLSTVDLAGVDLYSGEVTLKKAGAPQSFIRRGGRVISRELPSLPAGILGGIEFSTDKISLSAGDMVVMVSDGVITGDERWLEKLIRTWNRGSSQELAQAVVEEAIRRRESTKDDDITAVVMRVTENE